MPIEPQFQKQANSLKRLLNIMKPYLREHLTENAFPRIYVSDVRLENTLYVFDVVVTDEELKREHNIVLICTIKNKSFKIVATRNRDTKMYSSLELSYGSAKLLYRTLASIISFSVLRAHYAAYLEKHAIENGYKDVPFADAAFSDNQVDVHKAWSSQDSLIVCFSVGFTKFVKTGTQFIHMNEEKLSLPIRDVRAEIRNLFV